MIRREALRLLECHDVRVRVPVLASHFIPAQMNIAVRKELGHLSKEALNELISSRVGWIERWIENANSTLNGIRSTRTSEFRVCGKPSGRVPGKIELRHDPDAALAGVCDQALDLLLRVVLPA